MLVRKTKIFVGVVETPIMKDASVLNSTIINYSYWKFKNFKRLVESLRLKEASFSRKMFTHGDNSRISI